MFVDFSQPLTSPRSEPPNAADRYYDLGIACSSGDEQHDLIEAHKWFNLAAHSGDTRGVDGRACIAETMTSRQIADAQRRARACLNMLA